MLKHVQVLSLDKKATSAVDLTLRNTSTLAPNCSGRRSRSPESRTSSISWRRGSCA
jgi:hypothetical protein